MTGIRLPDAETPADTGALEPVAAGRQGAGQPHWWRLLLRDKPAFMAAIVLLIAFGCAVIGPFVVGKQARHQDLYVGARRPFTLHDGWLYVLGGDSLGRSVLAQLIVGSRTTLAVAVFAVLLACLVGSVIGMWAGFHRGWRETVAMRLADIILSFPSLLLAIVVLYVFSPKSSNVVLVLAVTRIPVYLRTARIESAELRSRLFVDAARIFGARGWAIIRRHILPTVLPTLLTVAALDFSLMMLAESALDFLGVGIQPPGISWGLMVSQGRDEMQTAWWLAAFPGLAIVITTVSATLLASWVRLASDPDQRWRLALPRRQRRRGLPWSARAARRRDERQS